MRSPSIARRSKSTPTTRRRATISASPRKSREKSWRPLLAVRLPVAQRVLRDNQLLNVRGALDNLIRLRVAQIALDRKLGRIAVRAENAERCVGGERRRFCGGVFRDGHLEVVGALLVGQPGGAIDEQARGFLVYHHLRDQILIHLKLADLLAELLALVAVAHGRLARRDRQPQRAGGAAEPRIIQLSHADLEALAFFADQTIGRHAEILERELAERRGMRPHHFELAAARQGGDYILNGTKIWISNAPVADCGLVYAVTDKAQKHSGISAFIADFTKPGVSRRE